MVATTLQRGQLAIIHFNSEDSDDPSTPAIDQMNRDSISFVLLAAIGSGTQIFFTDRSWNGTVFSASGTDGTYTFTAGSDMAAGTVITISTAELNAAGINLSDAGEAIYAYQGAINTPTGFLFALEMGDGNNTFGASLVNTGLTAGVDAIGIGADNGSFAGRTWNIQTPTLYTNIGTATNWVTNENSPQYPDEEGTNLFTAPDRQIWVAGSGGGNAIQIVNTDGTHTSNLLGYAISHLYQNTSVDGNPTTQRFWHPTDVVLDTANDKFFIVDSDGTVDRILQGSISQALANPGVAPTMTVLYRELPEVSDGSGITGIAIDTTNQDIYFTRNQHLMRVDYNTANQTPITLADLGTDPDTANPTYANEIGLNLATGQVFIVSTESFSDFIESPPGSGIFVVGTVMYRNAIIRVSNVAPGDTNATGNTVDRITWTGVYDETNSAATGTPQITEFEDSFGKIISVDVNTSNGDIWFTTVQLNNGANGELGGIYRASISGTVATVTLVYQETNATNFNFQYIDVDEETGRYYVTSLEPNEANDHSLFSGLLTDAGVAPTFVAHLGNINALGPLGLTVQSAPTLAGTGLTPGVTEASSAPASGETTQVSLYSGLTAADIDPPTGDELSGAQVRISVNFQAGATHQDFLRINGNLSGTVAGSGITYSYNSADGVMTLSGLATVAEYASALQLVTFSTSGDDVTAYGAAGTRTTAASVFDGLLYSDELTATVTVTGINDAPVNAVPGTQVFNEDVARVFSTANANALSVSDVDANPATQALRVTLSVTNGVLTLSSLTGLAFSVGDGTGDTTMTFTGTANAINAALGLGLTFTPTADYNGSAALTFTVNDQSFNGTDPGNSGDGTSEQDSDAITLTINAVVDIANDTVNIAEDAGAQNLTLLANDNFENTGRSITSVTQGANGFVSINDNGTGGDTTDDYVVYTAVADFNGADSFTYTVTSGGVTETATVNVNISAVVDIANDAATVGEDSGATTIDVIANDSFENGGFSITSVTQGLHGAVAIIDGPDADANPDYVTYTPNADYNGSDSFTYTVTSGGVTETATVNVTVTAVADIVTDNANVFEDSGANIFDLFVNDNFESAARFISSVTQGANGGVVTINNNGTPLNTADDFVTYTPAGNYFGPDTFTYTVTSGGVTEVATVNVTVDPVNDPPTQTNLHGDTAAWTENGGAIALDLGGNATIVDIDSTNFDTGKLTVLLSGGVVAEDGLFILTAGLITFDATTVSYNGTQFATYLGGGFGGGNIEFTFDADATQTAVTALVRALAYNNSGNSTGEYPTGGTRLVTWTLVDGDGNANGGNDTLLIGSSVDVTPLNDTPVVTVASPLAVDEQVAEAIAPAGTLADADLDARNSGNGDYAGATLTIVRNGGAAAQDLLAVANGAGFVVNGSNLEAGGLVFATVSGGSGSALVITFTGSGTAATSALADAVLQAVQYTFTGDTPPLSIQLDVTMNDGAPANAGQGSVAGNPAATTSSITVNITDTAENAAPVVDLNTGTAGNNDTGFYVEGGIDAAIGVAIGVTDTEGDNIVSATITITDPEAGDLLFANLPLPGGITIDGASTATTMILIGSASAATYATALGQVGFTSSSEDPTDGGTNPDRVITVTASDAFGTGPAATMTLTVAGVNDEPTLIATGLDPTFPENTAAVDLYSTVTADTVEGGQTFTSMTLTVSNVFDGANEILTFDGSPVALTNGNIVVGTATNGLTVNVTVAMGIATVTFTGATLSEAALQTLVDALAYRNTAIPPTDGDRVITITQIVDSGSNTGDNDNESAPNIVSTVNVEPDNQGPAVDLDSVSGGVNYAASYTEDGPAAAIGSGVAVTDPNSGSGDMIESATIVLTDRVAGDALTVTGVLPPGVIAVTTPTAGAITIEITGTGTAAQYQALIESIQYSTTSDDPTVGGTDPARTITVTVNDGTLDSAVATTTVTITATDDGAVAQDDAFTITEAGSIIAGNLFANNGSGADGDPDGPPLSVSEVNGSSVDVGNEITLATGAKLTVFSNGTFNYDPNGQFDFTPTPGSGASNQPQPDSFTYTLTGGGTATVNLSINGLDTNDLLLGTPGVDTLIAGVGNDTIDGLAGADSMTGGTGNDVYIVDNASDTVVELSGEGADTVYAVVDYALGAGQEVETLSSFSIAWTSALNLTGNDLSNVVAGNYGDNVLGGGFGGADVLIGFRGNDTYYVDSDDVVFDDEAIGGTDTVYAISDYVLTAGQRIETLSAYSIAWTSALNLTGNTADNILAGTFGDNVLNGGFGGLDVLNGFAGNDTYIVDADDVVFEAANEGNDIVYAVSDYVLTSGSHVETLSAYSIAWTSALNLTGNEVDNVVAGTAGANVIDGRQGNDYLVGFGGADTFAFTTALDAATNVDFIEGFGGASGDGDDFIALDDAVFTGLAPGVLGANAFVGGTAAADADDRIIYDSATGRLYFDADGNGAGGQILFATLEAGTSLTAGDFLVI